MKLPKWLTQLWDRTEPKGIDKEFLESYRKLLFGQFAMLSNQVDDPQAKAEAVKITTLPPDQITWPDLYKLELAVIRLEPTPLLQRRVWTLRNEYSEVASPDEIKDYLSSSPPDPKQADDALLRADAVRLQEELNWRYVVMEVFESFRIKIIKAATLATAAVLLLLVAGTYVWDATFGSKYINFPFVAVIVVPGILGGLIGTLQRIQKAEVSGNADLDLNSLEESKMGIYLSPLLGGVFALILFFLFAGGFITGNLFPKVYVDNLLVGEQPDLDYVEISKLIIWSFVAGFAEKFVPDKLERLTKDSDKK